MATGVPTIMSAEPPTRGQQQGLTRPHHLREEDYRKEAEATQLREGVRSLKENIQQMGAVSSGTVAWESHLNHCPEERIPVAAGWLSPLPAPVFLPFFSEVMHNYFDLKLVMTGFQ